MPDLCLNSVHRLATALHIQPAAARVALVLADGDLHSSRHIISDAGLKPRTSSVKVHVYALRRTGVPVINNHHRGYWVELGHCDRIKRLAGIEP